MVICVLIGVWLVHCLIIICPEKELLLRVNGKENIMSRQFLVA